MKEILLNTKGPTQTIDVMQFDTGRMLEFVLDEDVSDKIVKYVIRLPNGNLVKSICQVEGNYVSFLLPENATQQVATLPAQLIVNNQATSDYEDLYLWKQQVEAGNTVVLVSTENNKATGANVLVDNVVPSEIGSFPFYIRVNKGVREGGDMYETAVEEMRQLMVKMQENMDQINSDVDGKLAICDEKIDACTTAAANADAKALIAEDAANTCKTATESCNTAASKANQATSSCTTATGACNTATSNANQATSACTTATETAQDIIDSWGGVDVSTLQTQIDEIKSGESNVLVSIEDASEA